MDCNFPFLPSKGRNKRNKKFGGLQSYATAGTGVDVNGPKDVVNNHPITRGPKDVVNNHPITRDEPVVKTGEARKIPAG
ncbi:MAG: hypothetical protein ACXAEU_16685 [Candidatus Hodarchaeales archaeon]